MSQPVEDGSLQLRILLVAAPSSKGSKPHLGRCAANRAATSFRVYFVLGKPLLFRILF